MVSEWPTMTVGQLAESISDTHKFGKDKLIFLNTSDVLFGRILHRNYSSVRDWPGQAKKSIKRDDILFSEIRPANGRWAYVDVDADDFVVSTKLMVIRSRPGRIAPRFLYHFLTSAKTTRWLQHLAESRSGTFPQITFDQVSELELALPPMADQAAIVNFLDGIEDKIAVNHQMNESLDATCRALFKSWFIDFDPVWAKAERGSCGLPQSLSDLFPDSFRESEIGRIPATWNLKTIEEVAERVAMGPFGSSIKVETFVNAGVPVISGQHLRTFMLEDTTFKFIAEEHAQRLSKAIVKRGDVVFTHAGNIGQVAFIPNESRYQSYVISQRQFYMRCNPDLISPSFVAFYFGSPQGQHSLLANASSSGVPSIARPVSYLRSVQFPLPPRNILAEFDRLISPALRRFRLNRETTETLSKLRDTLLPRLVSGQLRIHDAERLLGTKL